MDEEDPRSDWQKLYDKIAMLHLDMLMRVEWDLRHALHHKRRLKAATLTAMRWWLKRRSP